MERNNNKSFANFEQLREIVDCLVTEMDDECASPYAVRLMREAIGLYLEENEITLPEVFPLSNALQFRSSKVSLENVRREGVQDTDLSVRGWYNFKITTVAYPIEGRPNEKTVWRQNTPLLLNGIERFLKQ